jgi:hypothetical protein
MTYTISQLKAQYPQGQTVINRPPNGHGIPGVVEDVRPIGPDTFEINVIWLDPRNIHGLKGQRCGLNPDFTQAVSGDAAAFYVGYASGYYQAMTGQEAKRPEHGPGRTGYVAGYQDQQEGKEYAPDEAKTWAEFWGDV